VRTICARRSIVTMVSGRPPTRAASESSCDRSSETQTRPIVVALPKISAKLWR
jgi:hypothetical protein